MSSMMPNPQTSSGLGGAAPIINAPPTDDPNLYVDPVVGEHVPQGYGLPSSPLLPHDAALGGYTDDQYLADDSQLRLQIGQQYAQLLQQLGYMDPNSGNVIPGTIIQDANIQLAQEQQAQQQSLRGVVQNAQQQGTLFSGIRGTQTADAMYPHTQNMAQIHLNTQRSLQDIYNQAQNLVSGYNTQNQQNLAGAAARNLALIQSNQLGGNTASPGTTGPISDAGSGGPPQTALSHIQGLEGPAITHITPGIAAAQASAQHMLAGLPPIQSAIHGVQGPMGAGEPGVHPTIAHSSPIGYAGRAI